MTIQNNLYPSNQQPMVPVSQRRHGLQEWTQVTLRRPASCCAVFIAYVALTGGSQKLLAKNASRAKSSPAAAPGDKKAVRQTTYSHFPTDAIAGPNLSFSVGP